LIEKLRMQAGNAVVPGSGPCARLAADRLSHARQQLSPPAMLGLRSLSDEVGHSEKNERTKKTKISKWLRVARPIQQNKCFLAIRAIFRQSNWPRKTQKREVDRWHGFRAFWCF
jgi:hypothetical protein